MIPYKFAPYSQKNDTNQGFGSPLKRPSLDVFQAVNFTGNSQKMVSDGGFSQSLSSRRVEPHVLGSSTYLYQIPNVASSNTHISAPGASAQLKSDEPGEIGLSSCAFATSTSSSRDRPKGFVKANTQGPEPNPADADSGIEPEEVLYPVTVTFRKLKKENVEQQKYIRDLESRLAVKDRENTVLSRDLAQVETAHKQTISKFRDALDKAMKNQSLLKSELDGLKLASQSSSLIVSEAKLAMENLATLRDTTQIRLRDLENMFDNDGRLILTAEIRETIHELRSELSKTQQVVDLLRDKLHTMGTELAEARARVLELEELITADRKHSGSTAAHIRESAEQVVQVTQYLEEQKCESMQAAKRAYEMEQQLLQERTRLQEAQSMIASMKEEITVHEEFQEEQDAKLRTLRHSIDFQEGNTKDLEARTRASEEELVKALNHNHELQGRLDAAKTLEKNLTQQASRLLSERDEAMERQKSIERHLAAAQASEKDRSSELAQVLAERDVLADRLKLLDGIKREADNHREKYAECQIFIKVLQERFDDQCLTLAASKESIGDLQVKATHFTQILLESRPEQERLRVTEYQAAETTNELKREIIHFQEKNASLETRLEHADKEIRQAAETTNESKREVIRLQEQNASLKTKLECAGKEMHQTVEMANESKREAVRFQEQNRLLKTRLERAEKEVEEKTASLQALQIDFSRKEGAFQALLETERLSKSEALGQLQGANSKIDSLLTDISQRDHHRQELVERLAAAEAPSSEREREVAALNLRIAEIEESEKRLTDRAATICRRYENNDLSDNERALVALLVEEARVLHSREIADKSNEIKRRDNVIKQHEARIEQLGNALARRITINDEGGEKRPGVLANPNTQNYKSWPTSAKGNDEPGNRIAVDATKPQSSDHQPETRGAGHAATTHNTSDPPLPDPFSRSTGHATFAKLCREDTDDIVNVDEEPPVATGKRTVMFTDELEEEALRPARRAKHGKGASADKYDGDQAIGPKKRTTKRR